jgi:hypothetical protein
MKRLLPFGACLVLGLFVGWYFGYTRPALKAMHMYESVQKATSASEEEMASYARQVPEAFAAIKREDESVATVCLRGIDILDRGDIPEAKKYLAYWIGSYYRVYHDGGDSNLIARIKQAAATNPVIAAEVSKKTASWK